MQNNELAYRYQKNFRWKKAAFIWMAVLADAPDNEYALSNLLKCQSMIGDFANAQHTAEQLTGHDDISDDGAVSLADYYVDIEQPGTALEYYRLIQDGSSFYLLAQLGLALCNIQLQRPSDAKKNVDFAKEVPIQIWQEYGSWSYVYLALRDYRNSAIAWFKAVTYADTFYAKVYALASLLSLPLIASSGYSQNAYSGFLIGLGLLLFVSIPPWSVVLYLLLLPMFLAGIVRNLMLSQTRVIMAQVLIMSLLLFLAFLNFE